MVASLTKCYGSTLLVESQELAQGLEQSQMEVEQMAERISRDEVLEDLQVLTERLGGIPSVSQIKDKKNGAKYGYRTYVKKLGPKDDWPAILGVEEQAPRSPRSNTANAKAVKTTTVNDTDTYRVSVVVPKDLKGTVTLKVTLE